MRWPTLPTSTPVVGVVILFAGALACNKAAPQSENACPSTISGQPYAGADTVHWGQPKRLADAVITKVAVECIPEHTPAVLSDKKKVEAPAYTSYQLATTSTIATTIPDRAAFRRATAAVDLRDSVILEASTANGVVLGSTRVVFRLDGSDLNTVSATIFGLTSEQIARITTINAKWCYCRIY